MSMNYCSQCGERVVRGVPPGDDRERFFCPSCETVHYQNPRMVVGCIPWWENSILLCRRAIEPRYGTWTLPAGFLENGESVAEGARRELLEEARATALGLTLYGLYNIRHVSQVYLIFLAPLATKEFAAGEEVERRSREWLASLRARHNIVVADETFEAVASRLNAAR